MTQKLFLLRRVLVFFAVIQFGFYPLLYGQNGSEQVTNSTIIELKKSGTGAALIKDIIASSACQFKMDPGSILALKKAGVEDEVISAMREKMKSPATAGKAAKGSSAASSTPSGSGGTAASTISKAPAGTGTASSVVGMLKREGSGIYYKSSQGITELDPTVYSQSKASGRFIKAIPIGMGKSTNKMSLSGPTANAQMDIKRPVFYFVFNITGENGINSQTPLWFDNVSSPNEFMLVKFLQGKDKTVRDVIVSSSNEYVGQSRGVDEKQKISFKYTRLEKGIYEMYFEKDLEPGEYCFMYAGSMSVNGVDNPKVYDFGVK